MGFIAFEIKEVMLPHPLLVFQSCTSKECPCLLDLNFVILTVTLKFNVQNVSTRSVDLFYKLSFPSYTITLINERLVQIFIVTGWGQAGLHSVLNQGSSGSNLWWGIIYYTGC